MNYNNKQKYDVFNAFLVENTDIDGVEENKTVAVGTHGCIKCKEDKIFFKIGLARMVQRLSPKTIIVYGSAPDNIFKPYEDIGINIIAFESEFSKSIRQVYI